MIKTVVFDVSWQRSLKSVHRFKILKTGHTKTLCCGLALSHRQAKSTTSHCLYCKPRVVVAITGHYRSKLSSEKKTCPALSSYGCMAAGASQPPGHQVLYPNFWKFSPPWLYPLKYIYIYIWVNYNISLTRIKAHLGMINYD